MFGEYLVLLLEIHPSAASYVNGHGQGCPPKAPSGTGGGTGRTRPSSLSLEEAHLLIWKATAWSTASNWALETGEAADTSLIFSLSPCPSHQNPPGRDLSHICIPDVAWAMSLQVLWLWRPMGKLLRSPTGLRETKQQFAVGAAACPSTPPPPHQHSHTSEPRTETPTSWFLSGRGLAVYFPS